MCAPDNQPEDPQSRARKERFVEETTTVAGFYGWAPYSRLAGGNLFFPSDSDLSDALNAVIPSVCLNKRHHSTIQLQTWILTQTNQIKKQKTNRWLDINVIFC